MHCQDRQKEQSAKGDTVCGHQLEPNETESAGANALIISLTLIGPAEAVP
jgi:hypothetical protein